MWLKGNTRLGRVLTTRKKNEEGLQAQGSTTEEKKTTWGADLGLKCPTGLHEPYTELGSGAFAEMEGPQQSRPGL